MNYALPLTDLAASEELLGKGAAHFHAAEYAGADDALERCIDAAAWLEQSHDVSALRSRALILLAHSRRAQAAYDEAERWARKAIAIAESELGGTTCTSPRR